MWRQLINYEVAFIEDDFEEIIIPSIWNLNTFEKKAGQELSKQMWTFEDKGGRACCLIPEVTGVIQEYFNEKLWFNYQKKPLKVFYCNKCYRYETPQKGRYREFTQFGIEILGGSEDYTEYSKDLLMKCMDKFNIPYSFNSSVKRGIGYYTENGFEVECSNLGAQKQVAGGGKYNEGVGWAIGVDRLLLALEG